MCRWTLFGTLLAGGYCGSRASPARTSSELADKPRHCPGRRRLCRRRFSCSAVSHDPIDESAASASCGESQSAAAVVFGHQEADSLPTAAQRGGIDLRQACVGFAEHAVEAIASVLAVKNDIVPPTINHEEGDNDENIDYNLNFTFNEAQKRTVNAALSNTFGFGGHNACVIVKKYAE